MYNEPVDFIGQYLVDYCWEICTVTIGIKTGIQDRAEISDTGLNYMGTQFQYQAEASFFRYAILIHVFPFLPHY
jgi:hypothetical protein